MLRVLFAVIIFFNFCRTDDYCPNFITCVTSEEPGSCPKGQFYKEKVKIHDCCSGCVPLKEKGQPCRSSADCMPGLKCIRENICIEDDAQACGLYKYYDPILMKTKYWNPSCLPDGSYAPKQCKGEKMAGKCFCVDKIGNRILGEEDWGKAENMTCGGYDLYTFKRYQEFDGTLVEYQKKAINEVLMYCRSACSRAVDEMRKRGLEPSYHCDRHGNFEPLQCDNHVCWCATPTTGIPYTNMVCTTDNPNAVGAQYHRQCESVNHILQKAKSLLFNHGTNVVLETLLNCNFDGSYDRVQKLKNMKRCVFTDNSPLTEAFYSKDANCNCAYDRHVAKLAQVPFMTDCEPSGNYRAKQIWDEKIYCIDGDGFYFSNDPNDC